MRYNGCKAVLPPWINQGYYRLQSMETSESIIESNKNTNHSIIKTIFKGIKVGLSVVAIYLILVVLIVIS